MGLNVVEVKVLRSLVPLSLILMQTPISRIFPNCLVQLLLGLFFGFKLVQNAVSVSATGRSQSRLQMEFSVISCHMTYRCFEISTRIYFYFSA